MDCYVLIQIFEFSKGVLKCYGIYTILWMRSYVFCFIGWNFHLEW